MELLKKLARKILAEELKNVDENFQQLIKRNNQTAVLISQKITENESLKGEVNRLKIKCEEMRQEILQFQKRPHFKRRAKKGVRK